MLKNIAGAGFPDMTGFPTWESVNAAVVETEWVCKFTNIMMKDGKLTVDGALNVLEFNEHPKFKYYDRTKYPDDGVCSDTLVEHLRTVLVPEFLQGNWSSDQATLQQRSHDALQKNEKYIAAQKDITEKRMQTITDWCSQMSGCNVGCGNIGQTSLLTKPS